MAARARAHRDRLGPALRTDLQNLFRDLVERLVPRDALPLAGAARPDTALRVFQAVGMVNELRGRRADRTEVAVIQRAFGIAFDFGELAVFDVHQRAAAAVAAAANALQYLDVAGYLGRGRRRNICCAHDRFLAPSETSPIREFPELSRTF